MDKKIVGANAGKVWHALNEADGRFCLGDISLKFY